MKFVHTADTHLGFETTRVTQCDPEGRRRRAEAIFQNFMDVVQYTEDARANLLIHSGDLFNKYYIPREQLDALVQPLFDLTNAGTQVAIIPGNHERSEFPFDLFQGAHDIFVFDRPKTICLDLDGYSVGIAGFPYIREDSRRTFHTALDETDYADLRSDLNILVTHQAFDQATVGPGGFAFREGRRDTVSRHSVPTDFEYVAAGHIHRYQILPHPKKPELKFVYPGSTQRVSFAEMFEEKGFVEGELINDRIETRFIPLPAYEMEIVEIAAGGLTATECEKEIESQFWRFNEDRVIRFNLVGASRASDYPDVDFNSIRRRTPPALECQFLIKAGKRRIMR
jgi:DNA repair exonuclease SbcCD nuclease subunit